MNKAFLFARANAVVAPAGTDRSGLKKILKQAIGSAVIVQTPEIVGAGLFIGGKVVTSLILVGNFEEVWVRLSRGKKTKAFVVRRDTKENLAELAPVDRIFVQSGAGFPAKTFGQKIGGAKEIGHPLLVVNTSIGVPFAEVAGMLYTTRLADRFEDFWKINSHAPRGLMGAGVWSLEGELVGISIGEKIYSDRDSFPRIFPNVYALFADRVMEFVESN